ncbi:MAG: DUF1002 domain-containing protein [Tissierellia bacterium]|nr:DUF1002 domain-containing protein [Tissierellia bacterium]
MNKKWIQSLSLALAFLCIMVTGNVFADVAEGDTLVSLGANLTDTEKNQMIQYFNPPKNAEYIEVTNEEEYRYLGNFVPAGKIGSKAISSAMVTYTKKGSGINITLDEHIKYITPATYRNALVTAGVTDADVSVGAPINVSGTAALTGIMKAYEVSTGEKIPEDVKKLANEEMVIASEITEDVGEEKTNDLINTIKLEVADKMPESPEEVRVIINNISNQYNINLSDQQIERLVQLFSKMQNTNIDWEKIEKGAKKYSDKAKEYLSSEEGQEMLEKSKGLFARFIDWIMSLFQK